MKKLGIGLTISAAVLGGFVLAQSMTSSSAATQGTESTTKLITEKEAKEIALKEFNGTITEVDFDQDDQRPHYEFEIESNHKEVNIEVDAKTGKAIITESEKVEKEEAANTKPVQNNTASKEQDMDDQDEDVKVTETQTSKPKASETQTSKSKVAETKNAKSNAAAIQTSKPNAVSIQKDVITKAEAIKIASTVAKGTVTNVELDSDDDDQTKAYELEFKDGNVEYDVEIDAYTGKILEVDQDIED